MYWTSDNLPTSQKELNRILSISKTLDEAPIIPPFFKDNPSIRNANIFFSYSEQEIRDLISCKESITYFLEYYYNIIGKTYYDHQYNILNSKQRYNIIIQCRQVGITDTLILKSLYEAMFHGKQVCYISTDIINVYSKLIYIYSNLPFFIKGGVVKNEVNMILFENSGSIKFYNFDKIDKHNFHSDSIYLDNFGYYDDKINLFNILLYSTSLSTNKITISSTATNTKSELYKLINNSILFNKIYINYKSVYDSDEFKKSMIKKIGIKKFASEYENLFEGSTEYNRYINLESLNE
jgi:hypothetical protein